MTEYFWGAEMRVVFAKVLPLLLAAAFAGAAEVTPEAQPELKLRIVSFNLRVPVDQPPHAWKQRKVRLLKDIKRMKPDIMGVQEATVFHHAELKTLKGYRCIGASTDRTKRSEGVQIYYNADRFMVINHTTTWLSDTPQVQSFANGANLPRVVTIGVFKEKSSGRYFVVANTHLHHKNQLVCHPEHCRALLRALKPYLEDKMTVFITGDFNSTPAGPVYQALAKIFKDAHEVSETPAVQTENRTFHGYRPRTGKPRGGHRIDFIWVTPDVRVLRYESVDNFDKDGLASSDHYPQCADVSF